MCFPIYTCFHIYIHISYILSSIIFQSARIRSFHAMAPLFPGERGVVLVTCLGDIARKLKHAVMQRLSIDFQPLNSEPCNDIYILLLKQDGQLRDIARSLAYEVANET